MHEAGQNNPEGLGGRQKWGSGQGEKYVPMVDSFQCMGKAITIL